MFESIWILLSTPFVAVCTGTYKGHPVFRNPFIRVAGYFDGDLPYPEVHPFLMVV